MTESQTWDLIAEYFDGSGEYAWMRRGDRVALINPDDQVTVWSIEISMLHDANSIPEEAREHAWLSDILYYWMSDDLSAFWDLQDDFDPADLMMIDEECFDAREIEIDPAAAEEIRNAYDAISLEAEQADQAVLAEVAKPDAVQVAIIGSGREGLYLNSVQGVLRGSKTIPDLRGDLADYEQDWIRFERIGDDLVRFVYASEDSTDVVGMLSYLADQGSVTIERFAFGQDRLDA